MNGLGISCILTGFANRNISFLYLNNYEFLMKFVKYLIVQMNLQYVPY